MNWHEYYINLLDPIAAKSKDPNTKVGCIVVGPDNEIRATGYNSFPRGINDSIPARLERPEKYLWIEHAERNAIYNAARTGAALKDCRLYVSLIPCMDCARGIVQAGITEVIYDFEKQLAYKGGATWLESKKRVSTLLCEARVTIHGWKKSERNLKYPSEFVDPWLANLALVVAPSDQSAQ